MSDCKLITVGDLRKLMENVQEAPDDMIVAIDINGCDKPASIPTEANIISLYDALEVDTWGLESWNIDADDPDWESKLDKLEQPYKDEKILYLFSNRVWLMDLFALKKEQK